jgi:hypothetical protein
MHAATVRRLKRSALILFVIALTPSACSSSGHDSSASDSPSSRATSLSTTTSTSERAPAAHDLRLAAAYRDRLVALNELLGQGGEVSSAEEIAAGGVSYDLLCTPEFDDVIDNLLSAPRDGENPASDVSGFLAIVATYCPARYDFIESRFRSYPETMHLPFDDFRRVLAP